MVTIERSGPQKLSRRHFVGALGARDGRVRDGNPLGSAGATVTPRRFVIREDRFGRMFSQLDPFFRDASDAGSAKRAGHRR
jgi:hypothetical protein